MSRGAVDVARVTDEDEAAAPRVRELPGALDADVDVVRAGDDDARKRKTRQRHVREAASFDRIVGMFDVARRDEKRAEHSLPAAILGPLRDERASEAVRGEDRR